MPKGSGTGSGSRGLAFVSGGLLCAAFLALSTCSSFGSNGETTSPTEGGTPQPGGPDASLEASVRCGDAGVDCLGGECRAGRCRPVELTAKINRPYALALDATHLFVSSSNENRAVGLWRVDKASGEAIPLVPGRGLGVVVAGAAAYLCDEGNNRLVRVSKDGVGGLRELAGEHCSECAIADTALYCTSFDRHLVFRTTTNLDGYQRLYFESGAKPEGIRVDAGRLYFALHGRSRIVSAFRNQPPPLTDAGLATIDQVPGSLPRKLALDETHVYWVDLRGEDVRRATKEATGQTSITTGPAPVGSGGITVDATHVYWVTSSDRDGRVLRVRVGGGVPEVLAENLETPVDVAVDDRAIYFTVNGLSLDAGAPPNVAPIGKVMRLAKPPAQ